MPDFKIYLQVGIELRYLAFVEAPTAADAIALPEFDSIRAAGLLALNDADDMPMLPSKLPVSGRHCRGYVFDIDHGGTLLRFRQCGWDGDIVAPQLVGEMCSCCGRLIVERQDNIKLAHSEVVSARIVYLEQFKIWKLIEVPPA